jgi:hypothetical protein
MSKQWELWYGMVFNLHLYARGSSPFVPLIHIPCLTSTQMEDICFVNSVSIYFLTQTLQVGQHFLQKYPMPTLKYDR